MVGILGISHKTASQHIRQQFAFIPDEVIPFTEILQQGVNIKEAVIVSTCNRTEIYYSSEKYLKSIERKHLLDMLHEYKQVDEQYHSNFYHYDGKQAVDHLFKVTSGVESMVVGEVQIVKQVKEAYLFATNANLTDAVLMRLFQKSFEVSKRVRTQTEIQKGATSVSYVAIDLCEKKTGNISNKKVLVVGAGETAALTLKYLKKKYVHDITITNRTDAKADALAEKYEANSIPFSQLNNVIPAADIVIVATASDTYLINSSNIDDSPGKIYIDLSVPNNIDPALAELPGIKFYNVDALQEIVQGTEEMRQSSLDKATAIIDEMVIEFMNWLESRNLRPVIQSITRRMQNIHQQELAIYKANCQPDMAAHIEQYTENLTQKYIRTFICNLKEMAKNGNTNGSLDAINELFLQGQESGKV